MFKQLLFTLVLILSTVTFALAQSGRSGTNNRKAESLFYKADEAARARDFDKALSMLSEAVKRDPRYGDAYVKAAHLHKLMGNKPAVFENLQKGLELLPFSPAQSNNYFDLAELYFDRGDYEHSRKYYETFLKAKPRNAKMVDFARQQIQSAEFAAEAMQKPVNFNPVRMPGDINKFELQYFPSTTADQRQLIFTARAGSRPDQDENIYVSQQQNGTWSPPASISGAINSPANEGAATISGDGKTLVFTSCNRPDSQGDCDLYISFRKGDEWSKPKNMGNVVNSRAWDSQPSLSADGRSLYFTSTRGGGIGKEDIWVTYLNEDGSWLKPENMGEPVNSKGRDMAPFVHVSGSTLYFVSDGHLGMGGLDVFMTSQGPGSKWSLPENMGYPLNTHADEGSLFITADNQKGYYSRQEMTEAGAFTIQLYELDVPMGWRSKVSSTYAQGRVYHADTKKPLGAVVQLYDVANDSLVQQVNSDEVSGEYTVVLSEGRQYALYVSASGFLMNSLSFDYTSPKSLSPLALDVYLKPIKSGAAIVLNNLFFDTNQYKLERNSKTELDKLITFMRQNPSVRIEISGHTDDVGSDQANKMLSERRAKSVVDYLSSNSVRKDRITHIGHGESKPVKPNTSEENRSQNRRIEMRVL
ncbi:OmpA family protein [Pontibacter roseus]|uniref:OmpA family protein n=1 Tax=Pontibacter roseus TaxID=336989 RepID=UPI00036437B4|nr:OmpA family protein [Pontibacter roseus]